MFSITEIWNATLTVGSFGAYRGFQAWPRRGALSDTTFEVSSISLRFRALFVRPYGASISRICVLFQAGYVADYATANALGELVLEVGGYTLPFEHADGNIVYADQDYCWEIDGLVADSGFDLGSTLAARIVSRASQPTAEIVSRPRDGMAYRSGETISVLLSFEEDVRVSGSPQLQLEIGVQTRLAAYVPARRGRIAAFDYTVTADDAGSDGVSIRANTDASSPSLLLNGGAFRWVSCLRGEVVPLGFGAVSASSVHAVAGADADTTAPTLSAATIRFRRLVLTYSEPLHFDRIGNRRKEQGLPGAGSSDRVSRRGLRSRTVARRRTGGAALEGVTQGTYRTSRRRRSRGGRGILHFARSRQRHPRERHVSHEADSGDHLGRRPRNRRRNPGSAVADCRERGPDPHHARGECATALRAWGLFRREAHRRASIAISDCKGQGRQR